MDIARYILLGFTAASLVAFITLLILYFVFNKKLTDAQKASCQDESLIFQLEKKTNFYGKIMYISAFVLLAFAIAFSAINVISAINA
jgi:hypothetical protein